MLSVSGLCRWKWVRNKKTGKARMLPIDDKGHPFVFFFDVFPVKNTYLCTESDQAHMVGVAYLANRILVCFFRIPSLS